VAAPIAIAAAAIRKSTERLRFGAIRNSPRSGGAPVASTWAAPITRLRFPVHPDACVKTARRAGLDSRNQARGIPETSCQVGWRPPLHEELEAALARAEAKLPSSAEKASRSKSPGDRPSLRLPSHLTREDGRLDIEHQACPCRGGELHLIGETVSEPFAYPSIGVSRGKGRLYPGPTSESLF
jgi:hypothetical protein